MLATCTLKKREGNGLFTWPVTCHGERYIDGDGPDAVIRCRGCGARWSLDSNQELAPDILTELQALQPAKRPINPGRDNAAHYNFARLRMAIAERPTQGGQQ